MSTIKKPRKFHANDYIYERLKQKAAVFGIEGWGWLTHFLELVATRQIVFIDSEKFMEMVKK